MSSAPVEVVWSVDAPGMRAELLGVDPERGVAVVWRQSKRKRPYVVATVDVRTGALLDEWEATGVPSVDQAHLAATVRGARYWMRDHVPGAQQIPGSDHVAWRDGEALRISDDRGVLTDLFEGSNLNQREHIAPDGQRAAWVWFAGTNTRFSVVIGPIKPDPSQKWATDVNGFALAGPLWAPDGKSIYMTTSETDQACLYRADAEPYFELWQLWCAPAAAGMSLALAPDGEHAVVVVQHGYETAEAHWLALPIGLDQGRVDGLVLPGTHNEDILLDDSGLLVVGDRAGDLQVVDMATGKVGRIEAGGLTDLSSSDWVAPGSLMALRRVDDRIELVRVDADKVVR